MIEAESATGMALYISLGVALVVWVGIFLYLWRIDALAHELRRRLEDQPEQEQPPAGASATLTRREPPEQNKELV